MTASLQQARPLHRLWGSQASLEPRACNSWLEEGWKKEPFICNVLAGTQRCCGRHILPQETTRRACLLYKFPKKSAAIGACSGCPDTEQVVHLVNLRMQVSSDLQALAILYH